MKLVTMIYDSGIDEAVMEEVDGMRLSGWTRLFDAHGFGGTGMRRGDQIFPGTNNLLLMAMPDEQVAELRQRMARLQATFRLKPGITLLVQPVEMLSPEMMTAE